MWKFVICILVCFILRYLRKKYSFVDYLLSFLLLGIPILFWIIYGFWYALGSFFVLAICCRFLVGLSFDETKVYIDANHKEYYKLGNCSECGYNDLEILEFEDDYIRAKCKRCGNIIRYNIK